jgi:hypothetical protein
VKASRLFESIGLDSIDESQATSSLALEQVASRAESCIWYLNSAAAQPNGNPTVRRAMWLGAIAGDSLAAEVSCG